MTDQVISDPQKDARARPRLARGILSRAVTMPVTMLSAMVTVSLTIKAVGPELYGQVALVGTLTALLPFADLGLGAAVVNAIGAADDYASDAHVRRTLYTSLRLLCLSGATFITVAGALAMLGLWPKLLGVNGAGGFNAATFAALAIFGVTLPLGLGGRLMQGTGRNHISVLLMSSVPLIGLVITFIFDRAGVDAAWFAIVPSLALCLVSVVGLVVACHLCKMPMLEITRQAMHVRRWPRVPVFHVAGPMLIIMIGLPLSLQTDRLVISHFSSDNALTQYAVAAQIYGSMWGVLAAGGQSLWPTLTYKRSRTEAIAETWWRAFGALLALAAIMATIFVLFGQTATDLLADHQVMLGLLIPFSFALLLLVQGAQLPCGMLLTQPRELAFQAKCIIAMLFLNIPISILLTKSMGAAGPVFASAMTIWLCQLIPEYPLVRRILAQNVIS